MLISSVTGHFEHQKTPECLESQLEVGLTVSLGKEKILKPSKCCVATFIRPFSPHNEPCAVPGVRLGIKKLRANFSAHGEAPPTPEVNINLQLIICADNEAALFLDFPIVKNQKREK